MTSAHQADRRLQPMLHDLTITVSAPSATLSGHDGQIRSAGAQGAYHGSIRALSRAVLSIDGTEPEPVMCVLDGPDSARFVLLARRLGDVMADPTVRVERVRRTVADGLTEEIHVVSTATAPVRAAISVDLEADLAPMEAVKSGHPTRPRVPTGDGALCWRSGGIEVEVTGQDAGIDRAASRLNWVVELPPRAATTLRWRLRVHQPGAAVVAPRAPVEWEEPRVVADDHRLPRLVAASLADLRALRLAEPAAPGDTFLGAGVPWFLTLFGRDSLWAARMLLPLTTDLAAGTLRVLARHQGAGQDADTGEAPGKIMHELRHGPFWRAPAGGEAPADYYGTVDATLLWIVLLYDAWRWGLSPELLEGLLPNLRAALRWLAEHADPDGDGFVEYADHSGRGLANQGWKDSGDAVRFRDGRWASPPIALCEVQGYAYQAARHAADLLDAFDQPGADGWREYAGRLADRFRARFWVDGPSGPYPAMALDASKRPVDALTSNIGHLLGTGLLTDEESAAVAGYLSSPVLSDGFGIRTMSTLDAAYSPLSYHCGSVWPHDTAIVLAGLARAGYPEPAARLADGLLAAGEAFGYRLPEVYGGNDRGTFGRPVPYPAACRPQAWSAAAAVAILSAALGLEADVPGGELRLRPGFGAYLGAIDVRGLRVAGAPLDAAVDGTGRVRLGRVPASLRVITPPLRIPAQNRPGGHPGLSDPSARSAGDQAEG